MRSMIAALIILLSTMLTPGTGAIAQQTPPIIDMHFHPQGGWNVDALVNLFDRLGVTKAAGGPAGPDSFGLAFAGRHRDRFIPFAGLAEFVSLFRRHGPSVWDLGPPEVLEYLRGMEAGLRAGTFKGIGEVFPNNVHSNDPVGVGEIRFPVDAPLMRRLWGFSAAYGVPLHAHLEADAAVIEMERLLESNRQGVFLWAHTGFFAEPPLLKRLFQTHPNLLCELSWRDERRSRVGIAISQGGRLRPEWKDLLGEFSDRFVVGTDVGNPSLENYSRVVLYWREILKQLTPETSERLAHRNAERILKLGSQ